MLCELVTGVQTWALPICLCRGSHGDGRYLSCAPTSSVAQSTRDPVKRQALATRGRHTQGRSSVIRPSWAVIDGAFSSVRPLSSRPFRSAERRDGTEWVSTGSPTCSTSHKKQNKNH